MDVTRIEVPPLKPVRFVGSSRKDLRSFPEDVRLVFGQAIFAAQRGDRHPDAKPLRGFGGAGVLEVVADDRGGTYRAVYTVRFEGMIYILHAFQKKSKRGIATPGADIELIRARLKLAEQDHGEVESANDGDPDH